MTPCPSCGHALKGHGDFCLGPSDRQNYEGRQVYVCGCDYPRRTRRQRRDEEAALKHRRDK